MNHSVRRFLPAIVCVFSLFTATPLYAATVRVVAVAINDERFAEPADAIDAIPGDTVEVELLVSGWGTDLDVLDTWQISVGNTAIARAALPTHCGGIKPIYGEYVSGNLTVQPNGAFQSHELTNHGVCSAASENPGMSCVLDPVECRDVCIGGERYEEPCAGGCPGGFCHEVSCAVSVCPEGIDKGRSCSTAVDQCPGGTCESREDFIFQGREAICLVRTVPRWDYVFGCTPFLDIGQSDLSVCEGGANAGAPCGNDADCPDGQCDLVEFYAGTMILEVGAVARGSYVLGLTSAPGSTWLAGPDDLLADLSSQPLQIRVLSDTCDSSDLGACCVGPSDCRLAGSTECAALGGVFRGDSTTCIEWCDCPEVVQTFPENCANDARYIHPQGSVTYPKLGRIGFEFADIVLSVSGLAESVSFEDVDLVRVLPWRIETQTVQSTELIAPDTVRIHFLEPMRGYGWYCLTLVCRGDSQYDVCWGHLPADVNNSGVANATDILELIDMLNGVIESEPYECDIDNSGACMANDVIAVVDLLNGVGNFGVHNNWSQRMPCPSEP